MLNEILSSAYHSIVSVSVLFIFGRLMGKKQIAQLTFFDYIIGISIGSIAAQGAVDPTVSLAQCLTGIIVFSLFSLVLSFVSIKSLTARKLLDGIPTVLIENGKIIERGLRKTQLNINDLLEECRQRDVFDISEIEFAILETSGKLSILLKSICKPLTPKDMNIAVPEFNALCVSIIIDGELLYEHLRMTGKDEAWLRSELDKLNIKDYSDILLAYTDSSGMLKIHLKNIKPTITPTL